MHAPTEGNPWCNTELNVQRTKQYWNMSAWSEVTWSILSGAKPPPDELFKKSWSWDKFQTFNMIAAKLFAPLGVQMLDVVPMTRLRPTLDWGIRAGKPIDCLHGNPAVRLLKCVLIFRSLHLFCYDFRRCTNGTIYSSMRSRLIFARTRRSPAREELSLGGHL